MKKIPLSHSSFYGIEKVVYPRYFRDQLNEKVDSAISSLVKKIFSNQDTEKYSYVRILDTFITGFDRRTLMKILENSPAGKYEIQILLLNPFSELSKLRAKALRSNNNLERLVKGLKKLEMALDNDLDSVIVGEISLNEAKLIHDSIVAKAKQKQINLSIKFTSDFTEFPVYIIGPFAMKGHILLEKSAENNPWIFSIDDASKEYDMYDTFRVNFEILWEKSLTFKDVEKAYKYYFLTGEYKNNHTLNYDKDTEFEVFIAKLKKEVSRGNINKVFEAIDEFLNGNLKQYTTPHNQFIILKSEWSQINQDKISGNVSSDKMQTRINNFINRLLSFLDSLKENRIY